MQKTHNIYMIRLYKELDWLTDWFWPIRFDAHLKKVFHLLHRTLLARISLLTNQIICISHLALIVVVLCDGHFLRGPFIWVWTVWKYNIDARLKGLNLSQSHTTIVPYANSLDPDETPSNSACHPNASCLTFGLHLHQLWTTLKHFESISRREI